MTKDEAILINEVIIRKSKSRRDSNSDEWQHVRCSMCCSEIREGQDYLSFIPGTYMSRTKLNTRIMHVICLDDPNEEFPLNRKTACKGGRPPLLTDDLIHDIINGKGA